MDAISILFNEPFNVPSIDALNSEIYQNMLIIRQKYVKNIDLADYNEFLAKSIYALILKLFRFIYEYLKYKNK